MRRKIRFAQRRRETGDRGERYDESDLPGKFPPAEIEVRSPSRTGMTVVNLLP